MILLHVPNNYVIKRCVQLLNIVVLGLENNIHREDGYKEWWENGKFIGSNE